MPVLRAGSKFECLASHETYHLYSGFLEETVDVEIILRKLVRRTCGNKPDEKQQYAENDVLSHCDSLC